MALLKYLLILLLFSSTSLAVFLLTSKGDYEIYSSKETTLSKEEVYQFVSDPTQFEKWSTLDKGATITIVEKKPSNEVIFETSNRGQVLKHHLQLKTIPQGTLITIKSEGEFTFLEKVKNLYESPIQIIGSEYAHLANNINFELSKMKDTYTTTPIVLEQIATNAYWKKINSSPLSNIKEAAKDYFAELKAIDSLQTTFSKLIVTKSIAPQTNEYNPSITFSLFTPSEKKEPLPKGVIYAPTEEQWILKTTLKGNDRFIDEAIKQLVAYAQTNHFELNETQTASWQYLINEEQTNDVSKWETLIWIYIKKNKRQSELAEEKPETSAESL